MRDISVCKVCCCLVEGGVNTWLLPLPDAVSEVVTVAQTGLRLPDCSYDKPGSGLTVAMGFSEPCFSLEGLSTALNPWPAGMWSSRGSVS